MKRLCVFCGSAVGKNPVYRNAARRLGELLAARNIGLVFGGGHIGLMGVVADAVLASGGEVIGVIPKGLRDRELAHAEVTHMHVVDSMHERKALMADLSDAFAALPGGMGTADELCEILTWAQLKIHAKPIAVLNVNAYFDGLLRWIDFMVGEGFVKEKHRPLLLEAKTEQELLPILGWK